MPMFAASRSLLLVLLAAMGSGCIPVSRHSVSSLGGKSEGARLDTADRATRIAALAGEFQRLGPVCPDEAHQLATVAIDYSQQLADWCDMVRPVELHNVMVHLRLRQHGLCYELADYLQAELQTLNLSGFEFHRGIAWRDDLWNEHNCIVVTAHGRPFDTGIVLDAWRNAGVLRWSPVRVDHYPWQLKDPP